MRKVILVLLALALLGAIPTIALAAHSGSATGRATFHPENKSGVKGRVRFKDDGSTLRVRGRASGLDPKGFYVSLIYDNGSVPGGPNACEPTNRNLGRRMFIGVWSVDGSGDGTLSASTGAIGEPPYAGLNEFRTISIRLFPGPPGPGPGTDLWDEEGPPPLVACGQVATHPAGRR